MCYNTLRTRGGVGEWLKPPVLKTGRRKPRGFESRPLRHFLLAPRLSRRSTRLGFPWQQGLLHLPVIDAVDENRMTDGIVRLAIQQVAVEAAVLQVHCLLYTSPSPRDS